MRQICCHSVINKLVISGYEYELNTCYEYKSTDFKIGISNQQSSKPQFKKSMQNDSKFPKNIKTPRLEIDYALTLIA